MFHRLSAATAVVVLFLLGWSVTTHAQEDPSQHVARSLQTLASRVEPGIRVSVIDMDGNEVTGTIANISSSRLALVVGDNRLELTESSIAKIDLPGDRLWLGMGVGAGVGALVGWGAAEAQCRNELRQRGVGCDGTFQGEAAGGMAALGAGIGAIIGWNIGTRELLFEATGASGVVREPACVPSLSPHVLPAVRGPSRPVLT